jgi:hypothetical protein
MSLKIENYSIKKLNYLTVSVEHDISHLRKSIDNYFFLQLFYSKNVNKGRGPLSDEIGLRWKLSF